MVLTSQGNGLYCNYLKKQKTIIKKPVERWAFFIDVNVKYPM
jgi:hypothetical protein